MDQHQPFSKYNSAGDSTSPSLVEAMINGEEEAWKKVAEVWGRTLLQYCRRRELQ